MRGSCLQDSLPASLGLLHVVSDAATDCCGQKQQWSKTHRLVCSSSASWPVLLSHPNLPEKRLRSIQTRYICFASDLIGHRALKKRSLFCFAVFPPVLVPWQFMPGYVVCVCASVCYSPQGSLCTFIPNDLVYGHSTTTNSQTESHFEGGSQPRTKCRQRE